MRIAAFNGFECHYEMYGYIIYFCKKNNHTLTIYHTSKNNQGYIEFYSKLFNDFTVEYKQLGLFNTERNNFDKIILVTDDDKEFRTDNIVINKRTISIVHSYKNRNPLISSSIAVRPLAKEYFMDWALPIYPIRYSSMKKDSLDNEIHISIIGHSVAYNTKIINRIKSNKKITFNIISRGVPFSLFNTVNPWIQVYLHNNINTSTLMEILYKSSYILTDVALTKDYTHTTMSGAIPLAFSTLTPLIISRDTNQYYNFKNVIEFDKHSYADILLPDIDISLLEQERDILLERNNKLFNSKLN